MRADPNTAVADPPPTTRPAIGLVTIIEDPAAAVHDHHLGVDASHRAIPQAEIARQYRGPVGQYLFVARAAATSKPRPPPISKGQHMRLLPDAADSSTGKHRHGHVIGYVDRHRHEAPSAAQPLDGLQAWRLDQCNALCQDVVGHGCMLCRQRDRRLGLPPNGESSRQRRRRGSAPRLRRSRPLRGRLALGPAAFDGSPNLLLAARRAVDVKPESSRFRLGTACFGAIRAGAVGPTILNQRLRAVR